LEFFLIASSSPDRAGAGFSNLESRILTSSTFRFLQFEKKFASKSVFFILFLSGKTQGYKLKTRLEIIQETLREQIPLLKSRFGVQSIELFGSAVRNEQKPDSDLDVLVTFSRTPGLFLFLELENHLSDLLQIKVDLVMKSALKPNIGRNILKEALPL
jgi:predicted nucleotidyltransferase